MRDDCYEDKMWYRKHLREEAERKEKGIEKMEKVQDITEEEATDAGKKGLMEAVECSIKHWEYNTQVERREDIHILADGCALCKRFRISSRCDGSGRGMCPLKDEQECCCREYKGVADALASRPTFTLNEAKDKCRAMLIRLYGLRVELLAKAKEGKQERTYKVGERIIISQRSIPNMIHILAQCSWGEIVAISLKDGNRWTEPIKAEDVLGIRADEMERICGERQPEIVE